MQTEILRVTGMTCGGCTGKVTRALKAIAGVDDVDVSLASGEATVRYDERQTSPDRIEAVVKGAGYGVAGVGDRAAPIAGAKGGCCG